MKRFNLMTLACAMCVVSMVRGEDRTNEKDEAWARAQAAIAVAKAKQKQPKTIALTHSLPYASAVKVAKTEGKPLVVSVGLNCESVCKELRPAFVTCHEATFEGNPTPRFILLVHAKDGTLYKMYTWPALPAAQDVKTQLTEAHRRIDPQALSRPEMLEACIAEMFALDFDGYYETAQSCPNGNCANCPPAAGRPVGAAVPDPTYYRMPVGNGPSYAEPAGDPVIGRRFRRFRHRVRCAFGMEGHCMTQATALVPSSQSQPAVPGVVGAGPIGNRLMKAYLARHGVPADDLEKAEAKFGATSPIFSQLLKLLLEEGLPLVIEWLKSLIG